MITRVVDKDGHEHFKHVPNSRGVTAYSQRPEGAPPQCPHDITIIFDRNNFVPELHEKRVRTFLKSAKGVLADAGYDTCIAPQIWPQSSFGKVQNNTLITFPNVHVARGFFYFFHGYHWENESGTSAIIITLVSDKFTEEHKDPKLRAIAARGFKFADSDAIWSMVRSR